MIKWNFWKWWVLSETFAAAKFQLPVDTDGSFLSETLMKLYGRFLAHNTFA